MDESTKALLVKEEEKVRMRIRAKKRANIKEKIRARTRMPPPPAYRRRRECEPEFCPCSLTHMPKETDKRKDVGVVDDWRVLSIIHSCFQCRPFVDEVHASFPLEIRDMVWAYLLESDDKAVNEIDQVLTETLRYRKLFSIFECKTRGVSLLHDLATVDAYHTGLVPIKFVRRLELHWTINYNTSETLRDPEYWPHSIDRPSWRSCFDAFRQVRHKPHFSMELRIRELGSKRSVKHFGHLLETFRPVYDEMTAAEAKIAIVSLRQWLDDEDMELHVTDYYDMDKEAWYAQFLSKIIEWDVRAAKHWTKDEHESSVRGWHVEEDREFDDMVKKDLVQY
ncbi:hypothetical protein CC86DRAFT_399534 [Ophiobolus disseminans]|uniref:Uncharacterized protein n=1 Tax=Ophiobolus disseminans TaxID=1469910 RepID=A0A6A7AJM7_9PLEO|nr:hypothetical protein CC86DRAFT_399534 [Ophiobolus disseminans]